ncbi:uncharacterized protein LOC111245682 isoform X2 [Varroa destructor]|uniref:Uncharacterized protein n=1 Tax=Varroa destructor TaxID=109461 RepID=A0A7M7M577_VARDE|nr:uncharacterized protein LOC111245682 isoform X2 [Varroa destructor]
MNVEVTAMKTAVCMYEMNDARNVPSSRSIGCAISTEPTSAASSTPVAASSCQELHPQLHLSTPAYPPITRMSRRHLHNRKYVRAPRYCTSRYHVYHPQRQHFQLVLCEPGLMVSARNVKTTIYTPKPLIVSTGNDIAHVLQHRNETRQTSMPLPRQYQFTGKQVICRSTRCLLQNDVTCVLFGNQAHSTAVHCTSSYLPSGYEFGQTRIHNCDNNNSSDTKPCFLEYTLIKTGPSYPGDENDHISSGILWSLFFLTFLMVGCFIYCWSYQLESFRCPPPLDYPGYPQFYAHYPRRPIYYVYAKRGRPNQKRSSAANKSTEDTDTKAMSIGSNND